MVNKASLAEKENSIILSELRQVRKLNQDLTAKNDELKRSNVDNEERNSKLLNKMDELKEKARDLINQNELLLDKNKKLLENESALTRQNHALNIEVEQLIQAKSDLEEQVQKSNQRERDEQESAVQRAAAERISHLESKLNQLQETIAEKNKTIRLQNQRISDIKKSVQKGDICLRDETSGQDTSDTTMENGFVSTDQLTRHQIRKPASVSKSDAPMLEVNHESYGLDINFQYLHNVIFKFITTYDQEAQKHLIKAIAKILQFTEEEEQTVKQSLEARNSWFRLADNFKF